MTQQKRLKAVVEMCLYYGLDYDADDRYVIIRPKYAESRIVDCAASGEPLTGVLQYCREAATIDFVERAKR